jgi:uncharacterized membrane protein HdeD (DUF308 family)
MRWLLTAAAIHACVFGIVAIASATRAGNQPARNYLIYLFGPASIAFSGILAACAVDDAGNPLATTLLGIYLCFVGLKLFVFAWKLDCVADNAEGGRSMPADPSSSRNSISARLRERQKSA